MSLPEEFLSRMKTQLGSEFPDFLDCYGRPAYRGVRLNTLKCGVGLLKESLPFMLTASPFSNFPSTRTMRAALAGSRPTTPGCSIHRSPRPPRR